MGHFVGPHVAVWNTFFALIQVAIGLGLLYRRTVRPALVVSFFWAFGVWFFGEGLGLIFTGSASALTGAPGSVFLYGLIGLMAWPRTARPPAGTRGDRSERRHRVVGCRTGHRRGGDAPVVWCGYWSLAAILFLLPNNRTPTSVSSAIMGMSSGEPSAYSHFLNSFGSHFGSGGTEDHVVAGHRLARHRVRAPRVPPTDCVLCRGTAGDVLLGQRPGSRRYLHGVGHRPQLRAPGRAPGVGHGAAVLADPSSWLSPSGPRCF